MILNLLGFINCLGETMKDNVETPEFTYTKHDMTTTDKFEDIDAGTLEYKETFDKLLVEVVHSVLENNNTFDELKFYMKQYYWSYENREQDNLPIDLLFEEWDPDREWLEPRDRSSLYYK